MIHTQLCELLGIRHPVVLGGMGQAVASPELARVVSESGALGTFGASGLAAESVREGIELIRRGTTRPFAVNFLVFQIDESAFQAALELAPPVIAFAWARPEQDLRRYFEAAHAAGSLVMHMAGEVPEAVRASRAGADIIVAQGTEGGGHVGWMGTLPLVPMVIDAVTPKPVLAAGGIADGRGLAAALALGADGVLLGTRFLASVEAPVHGSLKQAIVDSDGHDTVLTEIPDIASRRIWPGAMARALRNRFIERWAGREWSLRQHSHEAARAAAAARAAGNADEAPILIGQDSGLIDSVLPAGEIVERLVYEAEAILRERLPGLVRETREPGPDAGSRG